MIYRVINYKKTKNSTDTINNCWLVLHCSIFNWLYERLIKEY